MFELLLTIISSLSIALISSGKDVLSMVVPLLILLALLGMHIVLKIDIKGYRKCKPISFLVVIFFLFLVAVDWTNRFGINPYLAIIPSFLGSFEVVNIGCFILSKIRKHTEYEISGSADKISKKEIIAIAILAFISITLLSMSSFLYPFNDWVDANSVMTAGKMVASGKVLYRDVFEQKGLFYILIHSLASLISKKTFLGIYLFELVTAFLFGIVCYRIIILITGKHHLFLMPVIYAITCSSMAFIHGDSVEEFVLPILAFALLTGIEICISGEFNKKRILLLGLGAGIIFWMKYLVLGFFVGFIIYVIVFTVSRKQFKELFSSALLFIAGFGISSIPVIIYFAVNKALDFLWEGYFYNNIFVYSSRVYEGLSDNLPNNLLRNMLRGTYENPLIWIILIAGMVVISNCKTKHVASFIKTTILSMVFVMCMTVCAYKYYFLVLYIMLPVFLSIFTVIISEKFPNFNLNSSIKIIAISVVAFILAITFSPNKYLFLADKESLPQFRFKAIMDQTENAKILNLHYLDSGFYTVMGVVPDLKYYCRNNVVVDEVDKMQVDYIINEKPDYIITVDEVYDIKGYEIVDSMVYNYEFADYEFFLYSRK